MLPGRNGVEVCRELRKVGTPSKILMLTSRGDEVDKVLGLEIGADDYVTKPFSIREIVARVKALLRRDLAVGEEVDSTVRVGSLSVDPRSRDVVVDGQKLSLTGTEFDLLFYLAKNSGRAFTREHLLHSVWGYTSSAYEHTVNTHINRLRSKIENDPARPRFIQTVWGVGYKCVSKDEVSAH
jgi:DNA-binding response OmpR family regulator